MSRLADRVDHCVVLLQEIRQHRPHRRIHHSEELCSSFSPASGPSVSPRCVLKPHRPCQQRWISAPSPIERSTAKNEGLGPL